MVLFGTLLVAMLANMTSIEMSSLVSFSSGLLAYSMMLTVTFMGSRPRILEKRFGLADMYEVHAQMSMISFILIVLHIII